LNINDTFPKETIMGVYKIENTENHKVYIGSSKNIYDRWKQHLRKLKKNKHHSFKLQSEYNMANDKTIFDFEIIVVVKEYKLLKPIEELCINKFNSYYNGYNCCEKADNPKYAHIKKKPVKLIPSSEKFIWVIQNRSMDNFKEITSSDTTRILFLSTYLGYDGYLLNGSKPMTKSALKKKLNLSLRTFNYFYLHMIDSKIFNEKDNKIYLNNKIFKKGAISISDLGIIYGNDKIITRLYVNPVQFLYTHSTSRNQKTISCIFKLIPFVNKKYNICCENIEEINLEKIVPLSEKRIGEILDYSSNNYRRLFNTLKTVEINESHEKAIYFLKCPTYFNIENITIINPKLFYGSNVKNDALDFLKGLLCRR